MKRYHEEKHIIDRRREEARRLYGREYYAAHGRYRKTHLGCNKASCYLCHPEKNPKRIPTHKEVQTKKELKNYDEG